MQTLTEIVAAVVVHSSAVAYSHFGVTIEPHQPERPAAAERKVARSARVIPVAAPAAALSPAGGAPCFETRAPRPATAKA